MGRGRRRKEIDPGYGGAPRHPPQTTARTLQAFRIKAPHVTTEGTTGAPCVVVAWWLEIHSVGGVALCEQPAFHAGFVTERVEHFTAAPNLSELVAVAKMAVLNQLPGLRR